MTKIDILKRLYKDYTKKYLKNILISVFFTILLAGSTSSVAYLLDPAIKQLFIEQNESLMLIIPVLIIIAFAVKGSSLYFAKVIMINVSQEVRKDVQSDMFKSLINADTQLIDSHHSGKFIANLTNDVDMLVNLVSTAILNLFKDSLTLIGLLTVMFYQNWKLSLVAMTMIPLASYAAKTLGKRIGKVTTEQMNFAAILNSYLVEIFKNHKLTKIFQMENFEEERANKFINNVKEKARKIAIIFTRASPIMEFLTGIMIAIMIYYSAKLISINELEVSNFFSFLAAMMLAYQPVRSLATLNVAIQQGISGAKRVLPIIDELPKISEIKNPRELIVKDGSINFYKVSFNYPKNNQEILRSIELNIPGKKMTALVGHSGAGKSTILNLIPRLYDVNNGDIKIDNQSIYELTLISLRRNISMVSQETTLFDDSIWNNISYAKKNATREEVLEAAKFSFCDEFINNLPEKFETVIGENGVRLSGGEKQRISIARALIKKSPIILLDEATSSLDAETESKIQKAIDHLTRGRTTIVIAHRLSTIVNADKIYVIDSGQIIGAGTHDELIASSKTYKDFCEKQLTKS